MGSNRGSSEAEARQRRNRSGRKGLGSDDGGVGGIPRGGHGAKEGIAWAPAAEAAG